MPAITVTHLSFSYTAEPLLTDISFTVTNGERAFLIGPNGCGKSTLLHLITGGLEPDAGACEIQGVTVGGTHLPSSVPASAHGSHPGAVPHHTQATLTTILDSSDWAERSVQDFLDSTLAHLTHLSTRFQEVTNALATAEGSSSQALATEYDQLLAALDASDAWSLPERTEQTLAGLGLEMLASGEGRRRQLGTLSPGQRGRLALAATLLAAPSVLILDEPTNHLDAPAVAWLTRYLKDFAGPVLAASHDRAFLDEAATCLLDMDTAPWQALATASGGGELLGGATGIARCAGNYSTYLEAKETARQAHVSIHAAQQDRKRQVLAHQKASEKIKEGGVHLKEAFGTAKKFYADRAAATAKRRTQNDERKLDQLAQREVRKPRDYTLTLDLPRVPAAGGVVIAAREAQVPGRLAPLTLDLRAGDHLLLTGPNGSGKSTLLTWLATGKAPNTETTGEVHVDAPLAWVPQRLLEPSDSWLLDGLEAGDEEAHLDSAGRWTRAWEQGLGAVGDGRLGTGILHPSLWHTPLGQLSAGNQRRVQLALAAAHRPQVLILDEPTNYLDLDTLEALESALAAWSGTLLVASHDAWLIEHFTGSRLALEPAA